MPINSKSELLEIIGTAQPQRCCGVTISRNGKESVVNITLQGEEAQTAMVAGNKVVIHGATFEQASPGELQRFGLDNGFKITRLEPGKLKSAGINEGFIIVAIDREPVRSLNDLKEALTSKRGGVLIEGTLSERFKSILWDRIVIAVSRGEAPHRPNC